MIARQAQPPPEEPTSCVLRPTSRNLRGSTNSRRERASYVQKSPRQHQQPQRTGSADSSDHVIAVPDCASRPLSCQQHRDDHHSGASQRQLSSSLAAASRHSPFRCRTASVLLFHGSWRQLYRPTPPPTNLCSNISTSTSTPLLPDVVDSLPRPSYTSSIPAGNRCRHEKSLCRLRLSFFFAADMSPGSLRCVMTRKYIKHWQ